MVATTYDRRFINDPIHGSMGFSELELQVIESPAFRRLRNVKQLGLAHLVYPTADYSRFAHSLGVCHLAGRFMNQLKQGDSEISAEEIRLTRLAALTHDIGHYPFSHCFEQAIRDHYRNILVDNGSVDFEKPEGAAVLKHEAVSERVLTLDPALRSLLDKAGVDPKEVARRFKREEVAKIGTSVITSDFDVDRTDYLLRTAHSAGLPYGKVDLDYLIGVLQLAKKGEQRLVAIPSKAMRAAEHFLLGRFFDYQTVAYHKTITAFETLLKEAISALLLHTDLECRTADVEERIKSSKWLEFDDTWLEKKLLESPLKKTPKSPKTDRERFDLVVSSILTRRAPKLIGEVEFFAGETDDEVRDFENKVQDVNEALRLDKEFKKAIVTWQNPGMKLTKLGTLTRSEGGDRQDEDQLVHVIQANGSVVPLIEMPRSLMSVLSNYRWYCARIYSLDRNPDRVSAWRQKAASLLMEAFGEDKVTVLKR